jgi:hypothetical protein
MHANTVIAICSVVIAVASLALSAYVAWATRKHNRLLVKPLLGFTTTFRAGGIAGLRLTNSGLGPAMIIRTMLTYDGVTSHGCGLVCHAGWGGIQQVPLRASRMAARGWWPWLRAVAR